MTAYFLSEQDGQAVIIPVWIYDVKIHVNYLAHVTSTSLEAL